MSKAKTMLKDPSVSKRIDAAVDKEMLSNISPKSARAAAKQFISVLEAEISKSDIGATGMSALIGSWTAGNVKVVAKTSDHKQYSIDINFVGDKHRPSLYPRGYDDGVKNIVALLNNGYDAGKRVFGVWEGHGDDVIGSRKTREGEDFVGTAVADFMATYAPQFGVRQIVVSPEYNVNI